MQQVAIGWLVYDLSKSAFTLGFVRFLSGDSNHAAHARRGAVADRVEKRRVVVITESAAMVLAFVLTGLVLLRRW